MELAIPALALGGLYLIKNNNELNKSENLNVKQSLSNNELHNFPTTHTDNKWQQKSIENDSNQYESLTGEKMNLNEFTHNNLQHFYKKEPKLNYKVDGSSSILDNKMGLGSQNIKKQEVAPLFNPEKNIQFPNGAPNSSDFIQSRMNIDNKRNNEKPWDEIQVAPGINEGYKTTTNSGYNTALFSRDSYKERNVDELRTVNNPKLSFRGGEGPSSFFNPVRGIQPQVNKNQPDTYYEQDSSRYLVTAANNKKNTVRSEQIVPETQRLTTTTEYYGSGKKQETNKGYVDGVYRDPKKEVLGSYPVLNPHKQDAYNSNPANYGRDGYVALENNRSLANSRGLGDSLLGAAASLVGAVAAPFSELLHPTKKENLIDNVDLPGSVRGRVPRSYYHNSGDRLKTTHKETTAENPYMMNVGSGQISTGAYQTTGYQQSPTNRASHSREYAGTAGGTMFSTVSKVAEQNANINLNKEPTLKSRTAGGNISLLNSNVHIQVDKNEADRNNNYLNVPQNVRKTQPNKETFGVNSRLTNDNVVLDRSNPDILENLNTNPYANYF